MSDPVPEGTRTYESRREYLVQYYRDKRAAGLGRVAQLRRHVDARKTGPCGKCGKSFPAFCMDFDHLDSSTKIADVSELARRGRSVALIDAEIAKCELLCVLCHRLKTFSPIFWSNEPRYRIRARNRILLDELKSHPCTDCGDSFLPCHMDFDHVRGEKTRNVSNLSKATVNQIMTEVAKCDLVCAVCHRIRTHG